MQQRYTIGSRTFVLDRWKAEQALAAKRVVGGWETMTFNLLPLRSMMNGDHKWALYGACLALGGFVLMAFVRRPRRRRDR